MEVCKYEILTPTAGITDCAKNIIFPQKGTKAIKFSYAYAPKIKDFQLQ
jgi:hypothetical protein